MKTVEWWYDRSIRLWTCIWVDNFGNQLGAAQYAPNKAAMQKLVERMEDSEPTDYQI